MKLTEYRPRPTFKHVMRVIFFLSLALWLFLAALRLFTGLMPLGSVTMPLLQYVILISAFFTVAGRRFWAGALLATLLAINTAYLFLSNDGPEYYFSSPQKSNTLIIQEKSALLSGGQTKVYRKEWGVLKRRLPYVLGTDDNFSPFSFGQYQLTWETENTLTLRYYTGHGYQNIQMTL